jgi:hypothetical protein
MPGRKRGQGILSPPPARAAARPAQRQAVRPQPKRTQEERIQFEIDRREKKGKSAEGFKQKQAGGAPAAPGQQLPTQNLPHLTEGQNAVIDQRQQADYSLGEMANDQLGQVQQNFSQPFDWSQIPQGPQGPATWEAPPDSPDFSGVQKGPVTGDFNNWRQQQIDSTYQDFSKRMDPQFKQQSEDFEQQMANRGIPMGSELYNREKSRLEQSQNDARSSAMVQAQGIAGQNASQFAGVGFQSSDQQFGQALGQFGAQNTAWANQMDNAQQTYGAGRQYRGDVLGDKTQQRYQPLNDMNALYGSQSGMMGQNLAYSQGRQLQDDEQQNQKWLMKNTPRGGGGGGAGQPPVWQQYGFASPMEYDAYQDARTRGNQQYVFDNDPRLQQPGRPSYGSQLAGGLLGAAAGGLINSYFTTG